MKYPGTNEAMVSNLPKGGGETKGKLAYATKLTFDKKKNAVELENYGTYPADLKQVKIVD